MDININKAVDFPRLQNHIKQLQQDLHQKWLNDVASVPAEAISSAATSKAETMKKLMQRKRLWGSTGKAISLQGIRGNLMARVRDRTRAIMD